MSPASVSQSRKNYARSHPIEKRRLIRGRGRRIPTIQHTISRFGKTLSRIEKPICDESIQILEITYIKDPGFRNMNQELWEIGTQKFTSGLGSLDRIRYLRRPHEFHTRKNNPRKLSGRKEKKLRHGSLRKIIFSYEFTMENRLCALYYGVTQKI
jgi:hypothetical protein